MTPIMMVCWALNQSVKEVFNRCPLCTSGDSLKYVMDIHRPTIVTKVRAKLK